MCRIKLSSIQSIKLKIRYEYFVSVPFDRNRSGRLINQCYLIPICIKPRFSKLPKQNSSEITMESTELISNSGKGSISSNSSRSSIINNHKAERQKAIEMKVASCERFYACKYCCQTDLFVMLSYTMISMLDSCLRFSLTAFVAIESQLYKMLRSYVLAYRNHSDSIQRIIKGLCACFVAIIYIEFYITTGFLKFILKPIPQWMSYSIHGLIFKFYPKSLQKDRDFDGLNSSENTS